MAQPGANGQILVKNRHTRDPQCARMGDDFFNLLLVARTDVEQLGMARRTQAFGARRIHDHHRSRVEQLVVQHALDGRRADGRHEGDGFLFQRQGELLHGPSPL